MNTFNKLLIVPMRAMPLESFPLFSDYLYLTMVIMFAGPIDLTMVIMFAGSINLTMVIMFAGSINLTMVIMFAGSLDLTMVVMFAGLIDLTMVIMFAVCGFRASCLPYWGRLWQVTIAFVPSLILLY